LFLVATKPMLAVYGIAPTREAVYMVHWFGVGLLAIGMITWFARDEALPRYRGFRPGIRTSFRNPLLLAHSHLIVSKILMLDFAQIIPTEVKFVSNILSHKALSSIEQQLTTEAPAHCSPPCGWKP